ncbi:MAG: His/Gly/Thr/Pro-type tRNA ligase C-terminal domain-containing protein, partial [Desulfobulbaceae bacterium]|nr:His/Gly/Thr/Pro-type tRNA ligase C-terminal domain-containing protein [Desulfobulbaceae bacterium]
QAAVGAGGRYDGLVEQLGGPKIPGIGFALGMERLILLLQQKEQDFGGQTQLDVFVAGLGAEASEFAFGLVHELRKDSFSALMDHEGKSLKSQMKQAGKASAALVCIIGEDEMAKGVAVLRNMSTKEQREISLESEELKRSLREELGG